MAQIVNTVVLVGGGLTGLFIVLLALPQSRLRSFLLPIVGWCFALGCGAYILSPVDVIPEALTGPFGLVDDAAALAAGVCSALTAIKAAKEQHQAAA